MVSGSYSTTDNESINYTAATSAMHYLRIYSYDGNTNDYTLNWSW